MFLTPKSLTTRQKLIGAIGGAKGRSVSYRGVTIVAQETDELLFGMYARLSKVIHAAAYFKIDFAFVGNFVKIVKIDDFWRDEV